MPIVTGDLRFNKSLHVVAASPGNGNTNDQEVDSLGGGISATELVSGQVHDLFDAVPSSEASSGRVEYRLIYVKNNHPSLTLYDAMVYMSANTASADSTIELGLDPVALNGVDSLITLDDEVDSGTELSTVIFGEHSTFESGLDIGNLAAGEYRAIWVRRTINAGAAAALEAATITVRGDTDA
ncbi:hypothetical protein AVU32_gp291 [Vibrio phage ValKK3]|uniref:Uncharacterized protein n=1 Tax=Vibrio phage ValKK3 TaxID=1610855 RepID=A0A0D4DBU3_9CAUD|nr:hypothetical protein AVU32_gp291 [Vibrio phage ValKK3]AJT61132.1 hypothetical protein [Vibrio phage ValKK3]